MNPQSENKPTHKAQAAHEEHEAQQAETEESDCECNDCEDNEEYYSDDDNAIPPYILLQMQQRILLMEKVKAYAKEKGIELNEIQIFSIVEKLMGGSGEFIQLA